MWPIIFLCAALSVGLRLFDGPRTPLQIRFKLGPGPIPDAARTLMGSLDLALSLEALKTLKACRSLPWFQEAFVASCNAWSLQDFLQVLSLHGPGLVSVVGVECISRIQGIADLEVSDSIFSSRLLPVTGPYPKDRLGFEQQSHLLKQASQDPRLLSSSFACGGMLQAAQTHVTRNYAMLAADLLDGPCVAEEPRMVLIFRPYLRTELGRMARWARTDEALLFYLAKLMQMGAMATYASFRQVRERLIHDHLRTCMTILKEAYGGHLRVDQQPMFLLVFRMVTILLDGEPIFSTEPVRVELDRCGLVDFCDLYYRIYLVLMRTGFKGGPWVMRLLAETLMVLSQFQSEALEFPRMLEHWLLVSQRNNKPIFCRHLLSLLWSFGNERGEAYQRVRSRMMSLLLDTMHPGSDLEGPLGDMHLLGALPVEWKRVLCRPKGSWWDLLGTQTITCYGWEVAAAFLPESHVALPRLPPLSKSSNPQLDQHRQVLVHLLRGITSRYFCPAEGHLVPALSTHPFILGLFWVLIYEANLLRLRLPFSLHPLYLELTMGWRSAERRRRYWDLVLAGQFEGQEEAVWVARLKAFEDLLAHIRLVHNPRRASGWQAYQAFIQEGPRRHSSASSYPLTTWCRQRKDFQPLREHLDEVGAMLLERTHRIINFRADFSADIVSAEGRMHLLLSQV